MRDPCVPTVPETVDVLELRTNMNLNLKNRSAYISCNGQRSVDLREQDPCECDKTNSFIGVNVYVHELEKYALLMENPASLVSASEKLTRARGPNTYRAYSNAPRDCNIASTTRASALCKPG